MKAPTGIKLSFESAMISMLLTGSAGVAIFQSGEGGALASPFPLPVAYRVAEPAVGQPPIAITVAPKWELSDAGPGRHARSAALPKQKFATPEIAGQSPSDRGMLAVGDNGGDQGLRLSRPAASIGKDAFGLSFGSVTDDIGLVAPSPPSSPPLEGIAPTAAGPDLSLIESRGPLGGGSPMSDSGAMADIGQQLPEASLVLPAATGQPEFSPAAASPAISLLPVNYDLAAATPRIPDRGKVASPMTGRASAQAVGQVAGSQPRALARPAKVSPATRQAPATRLAKAQSGARHYAVTGNRIDFSILVDAGGGAQGLVPVRISPDQNISLKLKDLLSLFEGDMEADHFSQLAASSAADEYVTFSQLRNAGIDLRYDAARDRITLAQKQGS